MKITAYTFWHRWFSVAFIFLILGALPGLAIRYGYVTGFLLPFGNLLHTHSHVLVLTWLNLLGVGLLCRITLLSFNKLRVFIGIQMVAGVLMFFGFLYQSYGAISITGSSLQIVGNYLFIRVFTTDKAKQTNGFIHLALVFYVISTLGIFAIAPASILYGKESSAFRSVIEFFLHFQIQGWLVTLFLGVLWQYLQIRFSTFWLWIYAVSVCLTFGLFLFHQYSLPVFYFMNVLGVVLQVVIFTYFFIKTRPKNGLLIRISLISLLLKGWFQLVTLSPQWAFEAVDRRDLVLFYLHWVLIGMVMTGFLGLLFKKYGVKAQLSIFLFLSGYMFTELFLLLEMMYGFVPLWILFKKHHLLLWASSILFMGFVGLSISFVCKKPKKETTIL